MALKNDLINVSDINWFRSHLKVAKLFFEMQLYNEFCNFDYVLDILMAPLYRFVDNYVSLLGPAFVATCGSVMLFVVIVSYWIGLPYWWNKNPMFTIFLFIFGNWLLINAIFHFYMGITCNPGHPGQRRVIKNVASLCKKCIAPKPPRTHHCSVCKTCVLLMDHHCPWLNNCVGHYNRRYFFLYMVYIIAGVVFLMIFGLEIFYKEIWLRDVSPDGNNTNNTLEGYTILEKTSEQNLYHSDNNSTSSVTLSSSSQKYLFRRQCILFTTLMCVGTFIALGLLLLRHVRLISKGETTIEMHINETQTERCKKKNKVYINPYDYGKSVNWMIVLGIYNDSGRTWRHILFPSTHKPFGNGFDWPCADFNENEQCRFFRDSDRCDTTEL